MKTTEIIVAIAIYIATMVGILYLANTLGETENHLNYICGEVQELGLLDIDKERVCK